MAVGSRKLSDRIPYAPDKLRGKRKGLLSHWRDIYKREVKARTAGN